MTAIDTLTEEQVKQLVEYTLRRTRPAMERWLGLGVRGYDAADDIATAIDRGVRSGLEELHLIEQPPA